MKFERLELKDIQLFKDYLSPEMYSWESNFPTLFCWDVNERMMFVRADDYMVVYNIYGDNTVFMPPYVKSDEAFDRAIDFIKKYTAENNIKYRICGLTRERATRLENRGFKVYIDRDEFDYIYRAEDLIELRGKAFHSKRNFVSRFISSYDYEICDYSDTDYDEIMSLYDTWVTETAHSTLLMERSAFIRALKNYRALDLKIAVLKVSGKIVAFSVSSIEGEIAHTIFEKGDTDYVGIYQAINKFAAERYFSGVKLVNRQEDLGIEGLRKAKLSYSPIILLEKFNAVEAES